MEKQDLVNLYAKLKSNGDDVLDKIRETSQGAFEEVHDRSVLKGFKAGYEAAAADFREKMKDIHIVQNFPDIDLDALRAGAKAGIQGISANDIREDLKECCSKFNISRLREDTKAGLQNFGELVDSAEAGVRAKMAEIREKELSEEDRKIMIMVVCAIAGLIASTLFFYKKKKRKEALRKAAEEAEAFEDFDDLDDLIEEIEEEEVTGTSEDESGVAAETSDEEN